MFLLSVAKRNSIGSFNIDNVKRINTESQVVTFAYDNLLSSYVGDEQKGVFKLIESPLSNNDKSIKFNEIFLDKHRSELHVKKFLESGRTVYYHLASDGSFYCSSHIKLLRAAGISIRENSDLLPEFFVYRYVTAPNTLYKNIYQLKAGECIKVKISSSGNYIEKKEDFSFFENTTQASRTTNNEKVNELLENSITALAPVKEKISCLVSGGLDSSILFKMLNKNFGLSTSYSTAYPFENPEEGETQYALSAAKAFGSNHHHLHFENGDYLRGFIKAIKLAEEPLFHYQSVMFNLLFEKAIAPGNVIVSGQGADGFFGLKLHEKNHYAGNYFYKLLSPQPIPKIIWKLGGKAHARNIKIGRNYRRHLGLPLENPDHLLWLLGNNGDKDWVADYFNTSISTINKGRLDVLKKYKDRSNNDLITLLDFIGDISTTEGIWSKIAEGHNKILYYPFNNKDLIQHVMSVSWNEKLKNPKGMLRYAAEKNEVPEFIITRKKKGFYFPAQKWAQKGGILEPLIPLAAKEVDMSLMKGLQGDSQAKGILFWNFLNYAIWKRLHINNEPEEFLLEELGVDY